MLDSIIFCSTLALCDSLHSLLCRCTLFLSCTPTFVNWALPANKLRVMCCVFIKNVLEKHTPIKGSASCPICKEASARFGRQSRVEQLMLLAVHPSGCSMGPVPTAPTWSHQGCGHCSLSRAALVISVLLAVWPWESVAETHTKSIDGTDQQCNV